MNSLTLATASIKSRPLHSSLCIFAAAAGIALLCTVFLLTTAVSNGLMRNAHGIDIVVGGKGSPLQLILSTVYHADVPNGNIEAEDAAHWSHAPQVRQAIPLALGDNYRGWRIVGTTPDYVSLYHGELNGGTMFSQDFDAVAGALTGLSVGTKFAGIHGLSPDSDDVHHFHLYKITGVLKPTGTVLDRLILTSVNSVQELHRHPDAGDPGGAEEAKIGHQVTALLIKVNSPISVINLPREINRTSNVLAASPAYEMTRFSQTMGMGKDVLTFLGGGFITLSALMLLATLASGLAARRYDLAVLRVLGASPLSLSATVMLEGLLLSAAGALAGIVAGHVFGYMLASVIDSLKGLVLPEEMLMPGIADLWFLLIGLAMGLLAGLVPALSAARTDIAGLLAKGRA